MLTKTHSARGSVTVLVLAAAIGALAVPASALAGSHDTTSQTSRARSGYGALDGWTPYVEQLTRQSERNVVRDGRSPDTKDAALAAHAQESTAMDGRSIDTKDAALAAHAQDAVVIDGRSPDTRDFAAIAHEPVVTITRTSGFQWGDFGIGVAAAIGLMIAAFVSIRLLTGRQGRRQPDSVATA